MNSFWGAWRFFVFLWIKQRTSYFSSVVLVCMIYHLFFISCFMFSSHFFLSSFQPQGSEAREPVARWKEQHQDSRLRHGLPSGWRQSAGDQLWVSNSWFMLPDAMSEECRRKRAGLRWRAHGPFLFHTVLISLGEVLGASQSAVWLWAGPRPWPHITALHLVMSDAGFYDVAVTTTPGPSIQ